MFDAMQSWIDGQRVSFLLDVDPGKWAGLTVRQMAIEAECLDFYNLVYTPFSTCAHSMWHHVARYNLVSCGNPLHRYHRRPTSSQLEPDLTISSSPPNIGTRRWRRSTSSLWSRSLALPHRMRSVRLSLGRRQWTLRFDRRSASPV
jgi:hypothetical protein